MKKLLLTFAALTIFWSCSDDTENPIEPTPTADISEIILRNNSTNSILEKYNIVDGKINSITDDNGNIIRQFQYDGDLLSSTTYGSRTYTFSYDEQNELSELTYTNSQDPSVNYQTTFSLVNDTIVATTSLTEPLLSGETSYTEKLVFNAEDNLTYFYSTYTGSYSDDGNGNFTADFSAKEYQFDSNNLVSEVINENNLDGTPSFIYENNFEYNTEVLNPLYHININTYQKRTLWYLYASTRYFGTNINRLVQNQMSENVLTSCNITFGSDSDYLNFALISDVTDEGLLNTFDFECSLNNEVLTDYSYEYTYE